MPLTEFFAELTDFAPQKLSEFSLPKQWLSKTVFRPFPTLAPKHHWQVQAEVKLRLEEAIEKGEESELEDLEDEPERG